MYLHGWLVSSKSLYLHCMYDERNSRIPDALFVGRFPSPMAGISWYISFFRFGLETDTLSWVVWRYHTLEDQRKLSKEWPRRVDRIGSKRLQVVTMNPRGKHVVSAYLIYLHFTCIVSIAHKKKRKRADSWNKPTTGSTATSVLFSHIPAVTPVTRSI